MSGYGIHCPPSPRRGASRSIIPRLAWAADQRAIGLPSHIPPDWPHRFIDLFGRALRRHRSFRLFLESCVHCGACIEACPFYEGTGDPLNAPMLRADLARQVYRDYFYPSYRPRRVRRLKAQDLSQTVIDWYTYFYQCSLCRRCAKFCPLGIDTSEIVRICREILAEIGLSPQAVSGATASVRARGNALGISSRSWQTLSRDMEERLYAQTGQPIKCPVDQAGAEILLIAPAADLQAHTGTFAGYAKVFHAAGMSWTTSTFINDAANPGLYFHLANLDRINQRILRAARELKPRYIIWGESGHGWWAGRNFSDTLNGPWSGEHYLDAAAPVHICEWADQVLRRGAFHGMIHKGANDDKVVTLHDPCHCARSTNLLEAPRSLIKACTNFFEEMPSRTVGPWTLCCGGGGGVQGRRMRWLQLAGFLPRARALDQVRAIKGCNWVATVCDQCKGAIRAGLSHYRLSLDVGGVM
ncbi:MAG: (Fe-S)-binding protein, partial [Desulfarculaceae bacterium]